MGLIFGIGTGLFIIIVLWTITVLLSLAFSRVDSLRPVAGVLVLVTTIITIILVLYPREGAIPEAVDVVVTDHTFWGRVAMLAGMGLFTMLSLLFMLVFHWTDPVIARPIKSRRY
ncbi:hypothetical protein HOLleu_21026 [Holothuria leucospilota]|uniref:Transmembrane protein 218 n=1 Tax=Holothuria leucospilota TaxID=206669 RepID=A0A9Q1BVV5_HOLLE|nr:hypothetical protein HOLleu_21026 [Holothuria leucospilota]